MNTEAKMITVRGRVQGVGFRYFAQEAAQECELTGWVRNTADGAVEIFAQGTRERLQQFIDRMRAGTRYSRVDHVDVAPAAVSDQYTSFRIRY